MRDMLGRLQTISKEQEDYEPEFTGPEYDVDKETLTQQAVIFDNSTAMDDILKESHSIRKEISLLSLEVERLRIHNERYGTTVRRLTLLKRNSESITHEIRHQAQSVHARIQNLGKESNRLEEKEGPNAAVCRIARTQYDTLICSFHAVMSNYHKTEEQQRSTCRTRLQRQASIMGTDISEKELNDLVEKGGEGWTELSQTLCPDGNPSCRAALSNIKGRHKELMELEARLKDVHELFLQMVTLVEEQGSLVDNIQLNVCKTEDYIKDIKCNLRRAVVYKKKNPCLQCCPWLPCWN
ncbi:syntaxin-11-like [Girardinichthys multiradiatus]|uniref:syntaxin-11-like n=1 Tax=Girardinichthys multiradiatus TaxID=208333 RepID=UPI001FADD315|nr:syntaxin-11-like [Girardinichthys multiradiatus]